MGKQAIRCRRLNLFGKKSFTRRQPIKEEKDCDKHTVEVFTRIKHCIVVLNRPQDVCTS